MDSDFQEMLDRMHQHRQIQAVILTATTLFVGIGIGFTLAAFLFGVI